MTAVASFGSIIIKGFGFSVFESSLLNIPLGVTENIGLLAAALVTRRFQDTRCLMQIILNAPAVFGTALMNYLPQSNRAGRLCGFYLVNFCNGVLPLLWAFSNSNTAGHTKRTVSNAINFLAYAGEQPR